MNGATLPALFGSAEAFKAAVGQKHGPTDWLVVDQQRINQFADATGDHQWIHVDVERAKKGPFGGTVAHGYLTLGLVNYFLPRLVVAENSTMGVNYGCDRVRFPSAVREGSRVRGHAEILKAEDVPKGVQVTIRITIEIEGGDKPACVADTLGRYYF